MAVHAGQDLDVGEVRSHIPPIYQTVNYNYRSMEEGMAVFTHQQPGYIYTRESNPTVDVLLEIIKKLEVAEAAQAFASGMGAISAVFLATLKPGDHLIAGESIYGGTIELLRTHLRDLQVETTFVDATKTATVEKAFRANTKLVYVEPISNPTMAVVHVPELATLAHKHDALLVVDNTFTPPDIFRPLTVGADIVVHSATKYLGGHGDVIAGVVASNRAFIKKIHSVSKYFGGVISPFNAWLLIRGIRTLGVRLERHNKNALAISQFLAKHPKVEDVFYPGLPSHPQHAVARELFKGFGGMLAFGVKGGIEAGKHVMSTVRVCNFTVSLGEIDTLIVHPASTSHVNLSRDERLKIGVTDGLIRLSVGIEDAEDLIADLAQALERV